MKDLNHIFSPFYGETELKQSFLKSKCDSPEGREMVQKNMRIQSVIASDGTQWFHCKKCNTYSQELSEVLVNCKCK